MLTLQPMMTGLSLPQPVILALTPVINTKFNRFVVDSRQVAADDVFVLLKSQNPHDIPDLQKITRYVHEVAGQAAFILSEIDLSPVAAQFSLPIIYLPTIRDYLGALIQQSLQLNDPQPLPAVVAVTGTNGKTTVSQLIAQLVSQSEQKTGVMGTAGNGILTSQGQLSLTPTTHTTLEVFNLQHALYDFAKQGVKILAIEASSHGLHQQRLQAMPVTVAVFTNLSRDHLDYHTDMQDYANAKARLFNSQFFPELTHAIINVDDEFAKVMIDQVASNEVTVWRYSLTNPEAEFFAKSIKPSLEGVELVIATPMGEITLVSPLLGRFNVANLLASIAAAAAMGMSLSALANAVPKLKGAVGRMDKVACTKGCFIVDYAHTPDALEQVLISLKPHCDGRLWVVFGCGGDRDKGKRPLMTQVALCLADQVILTADNPRTEDPHAILLDMQAGMSQAQHNKTVVQPDRKAAIHYAVRQADANDIVVIAGKGHETYQEINGVRYDFDDRVMIAEALKLRQD